MPAHNPTFASSRFYLWDAKLLVGKCYKFRECYPRGGGTWYNLYTQVYAKERYFLYGGQGGSEDIVAFISRVARRGGPKILRAVLTRAP